MDYVSGGNDMGAFYQVGFGYAARFGAGATGPDSASVRDVRLHNFLQRLEAFFLYVVRIAPVASRTPSMVSRTAVF